MDINNFRVAPDGKNIELWIEVPEGPYYEDITIDKIAIQDHNHYTSGYPDKPQVELSSDSPIDVLKIVDNKKVVRILSLSDLKILGINCTGMYFMYVKSKGIPSEEVACCCFKQVTIAVAANLLPIYNKAIKFINKAVCDPCDFYKEDLIDIYWQKQMFLQALQLHDYETAIYIYNNFLFREIKEGDCLDACGNNQCNKSSISVVSTCRTCGH